MVRVSPTTVMKGVGLYFAAAVGGYLYLRSAKAPAPSPCSRCGGGGGDDGAEAAAGGLEAFDRLADVYDSCINTDETFMGIKLMRRWLVRQAVGDVLEVSAGTGRNLPYYDLRRLRSLTLTDASRHMLVNAADKYAGMAPPPGAAPVRFELADAQRLLGSPPAGGGGGGGSGDPAHSDGALAPSTGAAGQQLVPSTGAAGQQLVAGTGADEQQQAPGSQQTAAAAAPSPQHRPPLQRLRTFAPCSFDVVVDTFGLCSQQDPVTALKEMARVCRPGGRILLLQHGIGTWHFVNAILNKGADDHFRRWGCFWNRDIERIVRQAGLEVESMSRWHFGTTYLVVARPPAGG